jgi:hypothetical protein
VPPVDDASYRISWDQGSGARRLAWMELRDVTVNRRVAGSSPEERLVVCPSPQPQRNSKHRRLRATALSKSLKANRLRAVAASDAI